MSINITTEVQLLIKKYKSESNIDSDHPLDGDEVSDLVRIIQAEADLDQGNITEYEYLELIQ